MACRSYVGGLSVIRRWLVGYKSVACRFYVGGLSVTCRGLLVICRPTLGPMVSGGELFFTMLMLFCDNPGESNPTVFVQNYDKLSGNLCGRKYC